MGRGEILQRRLPNEKTRKAVGRKRLMRSEALDFVVAARKAAQTLCGGDLFRGSSAGLEPWELPIRAPASEVCWVPVFTPPGCLQTGCALV